MDRNRSLFKSCKNCGAALDPNAFVCNSCGGVVPIEEASRRLRGHAGEWLSRLLAVLNERTLLLWILAVTPILLGPPLLALWGVYIRSRREHPKTETVIIVAIALTNIVMSALFWHWLSETTFAAWPAFWHFLRSLGFESAPAIKTVPI